MSAPSSPSKYDLHQQHLQVMHAPKGRWSKLYLRKINEQHFEIEKDREQEFGKFCRLAYSVILLQRAVRRFILRLAKKLGTAKLSGSKQLSLEFFEWPSEPEKWNESWGRSLHCYFCKKPTISDAINCIHCGAVAHRLCGIEHQAAALNTLQAARKFSFHKSAALGKTRTFLCDSCGKFYDDERDYYESCFQRLKAVKTRDYYRGVISRALLFFIDRYRKKKRDKALILLRNAMRRHSLVKMYQSWRRSCLRVIILDVLSLPPIVMESNDKCLIVLTIVDPVKHSQLFRIDKKPDAVLQEGYLLPGISGYMTIVLSICVKRDDSHSTYFLISQSQLVLRDIDNFIAKRTVNLSFTKLNMWMPTDPKKEHSCHIIPHASHHVSTSQDGNGDALGDDLNNEEDIELIDEEEDISGDTDAGTDTPSRGKMSPVDLTPTKPIRTSMTGGRGVSSLSSPVRQLSSTGNLSSGYKSSPASPMGRIQTALAAAASLGTNPPGTAPSIRAHTIIAKLLGPNAQTTGRMLFAPRCPISTVCAYATGPPLDVLRKVTDVTKLNKNKNVMNNRLLAMNAVEQQSRKRRWWIILSDLKLYFFEQYGDPKPKLIADIISVTVSPRKVLNNCLTFMFPDQRVWQLEFPMLNEATSFEFAILETQRCINEGGSRYLRLSDVMMGRSIQIHGILTVS